MFTDAYFPRINGVSVSVRSYAAELTKLGHEVCVVCLEYTEEQQRNALFDEKSSDKASPFRIVRVPSNRMLFSKEDRVARLNKWRFIKKRMDAFGPDLVHVNSEAILGYFGIFYSRHRHIPYVFTFHTMWEDYLANYVPFMPDKSLRFIARKVMRHYMRHASAVIVPTTRVAEVVARYGIEQKPHILPTGIPASMQKFSLPRSLAIGGQLARKFPQVKGCKILLYAGRIVREKNLPFLYDVLVRVRERFPKTVLLMVGGGPYQEDLEALSRARGLERSVVFTGYMPASDMIYFYKMAQVFVFPSKTETQGLVTVEAMLAGLPVVAIGELGTADVMRGDNGGFMVTEDVAEFSGRVLALLENQSLRRQKSEEARRWGSQWSISALAPQLVHCYEDAVREYRRGTRHRRETHDADVETLQKSAPASANETCAAVNARQTVTQRTENQHGGQA